MATYAWTGYDQLITRLDQLGDPDPTSMLEEWEQIIEADNRQGIMASTDKDDKPLAPVTYRPKGRARKKLTVAQKNARRTYKTTARGVFSGIGPSAAGLHNNLTTREYQKLGGPPLAPRGIHSRVITNLFTEHRQTGANMWEATASWKEVVDIKGEPFLHDHFEGLATGRNRATRLPKRDLRGVRRWGKTQAVAAMNRWGARLLAGRS